MVRQLGVLLSVSPMSEQQRKPVVITDDDIRQMTISALVARIEKNIGLQAINIQKAVDELTKLMKDLGYL